MLFGITSVLGGVLFLWLSRHLGVIVGRVIVLVIVLVIVIGRRQDVAGRHEATIHRMHRISSVLAIQ
jgi:hypothetical protein